MRVRITDISWKKQHTPFERNLLVGLEFFIPSYRKVDNGICFPRSIIIKALEEQKNNEPGFDEYLEYNIGLIGVDYFLASNCNKKITN